MARGSSPILPSRWTQSHISNRTSRGEDRFTTRDMIEAEQRLHRAAELMAEKELHEVSDRNREAALARAEQRGLILSGE
ncbi:hypothetical protein GCM10011499_08100 [Pelagibacterium lentulum]|uniref:Uncharacterized protein n=1 Tax=Pelagibacterium lentulum TaxID=2029865 RepID=A0A916RAK2_9HYPH|nr:hypothetical protein GCM10011499_08100 [Pelagibacterium lentulum]